MRSYRSMSSTARLVGNDDAFGHRHADVRRLFPSQMQCAVVAGLHAGVDQQMTARHRDTSFQRSMGLATW